MRAAMIDGRDFNSRSFEKKCSGKLLQVEVFLMVMAFFTERIF